jgi:hypothetical protein
MPCVCAYQRVLHAIAGCNTSFCRDVCRDHIVGYHLRTMFGHTGQGPVTATVVNWRQWIACKGPCTQHVAAGQHC